MQKVFGVFSFLLLFLTLFSSVSFAKTITPSPTSPVGKVEHNDYFLAYPGMLPDSPFYVLKVLRDKLMAAMTTDPVKKVDYYLLQTDKQIGMVTQLVDKNEIDLAKKTALKGENNFTELVFVYRTTGTKLDGKTLQKLQKAADKHQEVLADVMKKVDTDDAKVFQQVSNFSKTNTDSLEKIFHAQKQ